VAIFLIKFLFLSWLKSRLMGYAKLQATIRMLPGVTWEHSIIKYGVTGLSQFH
jgi:hypothetical protein